MYIIKKKIAGKNYYYLRESKREGDKVKAVTLAYLGKTKKEAEQKAEKFKKEITERAEKIKNKQKVEIKMEETRKEEKKKVKKAEKTEKKERKPLTIDELTSFCKRKGFVFQSSAIYGGFSGFWDFGHLGTELYNNIKKEWWKYFVQQKENIIGIDASVISHPKTWKASGHLESFSDVSVKCKKCHKFNKVDKNELEKARCSFCNGELDKQTAKELSLMFKTSIGPVEEDSIISYLRPETAQAMFLDFKLVQETSRKQLPFGIAQIGKCFRNEIAPRDFLFRSREFTIAEFEFFIHPEEKKCSLLDELHLNLKLNLLNAETQEKGEEETKETTIKKMLNEKKLDEWHAYWLAEQILWLRKIGLQEIKVREHLKNELSHYSSATFDIDYEYPFGSKEIAGIANRGQYDLRQHMKESQESLEIFDEATKKKIIPRVIEPTFGIERVFLALLYKAYTYDEKRDNIVLKLPFQLAPIKAAVFPIVNDEKMIKLAREIYLELRKEFNVNYDSSGSIGKRYSRNDEIATPFCITVDEKSLNQKDVTIRNRDDTEQIRVKISLLREILRKLISAEINFHDAGKRVYTRKK